MPTPNPRWMLRSRAAFALADALHTSLAKRSSFRASLPVSPSRDEAWYALWISSLHCRLFRRRRPSACLRHVPPLLHPSTDARTNVRATSRPRTAPVMRDAMRGHQGNHQRSAEVIRGHQSSSEVLRKAPQAAKRSAIRGHQWSSVIIRGNQVAITSSCQPICSVSSQRADLGGDGCVGRSWQRATRSAIGSPSSSSSVSYLMRQAIRGHQRSSEVIRGHQRSSEVIRRCSYLMRQAIRGHQKSARAQWGVRALCEARCRTRRALAASRAVQT